jgi:hypothetical protein
VNGHDLTDPENVVVVQRGKYRERQCLPCRRKRSRAWWRKNRSTTDKRRIEDLDEPA